MGIFVERSWGLWVELFRGLPYGDPYVALLSLAVVLAVLGIGVKQLLNPV